MTNLNCCYRHGSTLIITSLRSLLRNEKAVAAPGLPRADNNQLSALLQQSQPLGICKKCLLMTTNATEQRRKDLKKCILGSLVFAIFSTIRHSVILWVIINIFVLDCCS